MKKILPVIIILIGLSILGLVVLQTSWLANLLKVREQQIFDKIVKAHATVVETLSNKVYDESSIKFPQSLKIFMQRDDFFNSYKSQRLVSQLFSQKEINELIGEEFNKEDLKKLKYEFALLDYQDNTEMYSKNFIKVYYDSTLNKKNKLVLPIVDNKKQLKDINDVEKLAIFITTDIDAYVWGSLVWFIAGSFLFTAIIFAAFYVTVKTLLNQKKLSEIKSDFINNMTHEFKTPLATISLAIDAIKNEKVLNDPLKLQYFSNIIRDENKRMNAHVETILQAALLEKKELQFKVKQTNANILIASVVDNFHLQLNQKNGVCELDLLATNDKVSVDEFHFSNAISNLVDNAIKYSNEGLKIKILTQNTNDKFIFKIEDNGIGMSKETVKNVFEKFFRAHTGNVHNVKGFGLGMNYVKTIIDEFDGVIYVSSILGKGTTFTVEIPLSK